MKKKLTIGYYLLGTNSKNCFILTKLKIQENIMIEYDFSPVFYITALKIFLMEIKIG